MRNLRLHDELQEDDHLRFPLSFSPTLSLSNSKLIIINFLYPGTSIIKWLKIFMETGLLGLPIANSFICYEHDIFIMHLEDYFMLQKSDKHFKNVIILFFFMVCIFQKTIIFYSQNLILFFTEGRHYEPVPLTKISQIKNQLTSMKFLHQNYF